MSPIEFNLFIKESFGGVPSKEDWVSDEDRSRIFKLGLVKGYGKDKEDREELFGYKSKPKKEPMRITEMKLKEIMKKEQPVNEMALTSKRIYNRIAADLKALDIDQTAKEKVSDMLVRIFQEDNTRFSKDRWETAVFGKVLHSTTAPEDDLPF